MSQLRTFIFAAGLSLAAAGAILAPTNALAHGFHGGGHGGWGHHGGGHWGGGWGYGPRFVYGGGCFTKRYINPWGEIVYRRVCY